jgi:nitroreductase
MIESIYTRRSIRRYKKDPISDADLKSILSAGLSAPTGEGAHSLEMIVIKNDTAKEKINTFYEWAKFCTQSPVSVLVCYDKSKIPEEYGDNQDLGKLDAAAGIQNMLLCATDLRIASCWCHALENVDDNQNLFNLPKNIIPTALVVLGYSDTPFAYRDGFDQSKIHNENW